MSFLHDCNLAWRKSKEEAFIQNLKLVNERRAAIAHFELNVREEKPYVKHI